MTFSPSPAFCSIEELINPKGATRFSANRGAPSKPPGSNPSNESWLTLSHDQTPGKKRLTEKPLTPYNQTSPTDSNKSTWTSSSEEKYHSDMSSPILVSRGVAKKKLAVGLASLYDDVKEGLQSPIRGTIKSPSGIYSEIDGYNGSTTKNAPPSAMDYRMDPRNLKNVAARASIAPEWIGTSQFYTEHSISMQMNGQLDALIAYRKAIVNDIYNAPHSPALYIDLSSVDSKLGFCDIGTANAHRALALIKAGLSIDRDDNPKGLGTKVRHSIAQSIKVESIIIIKDELKSLHLKAYRELLNGMLGAAAFWEGLLEAKKALQKFPEDAEILEMRKSMKHGFEDRHNGLRKLGAENREDFLSLTRMGKIYQKRYPWLDERLYMRTPALVREVNKNFGAGNCKVGQVFYGAARKKSTPPAKNEDVGPLGVFATRDIHEGELVMVDQCLTGISNVPSSRLTHCDACHASLRAPFIHPSDVLKQICCERVAFCSPECYAAASKGYHSIICGKDIDWIYEYDKIDQKEGDAGGHWRPIQFLRMMCIVLADIRSQEAAGIQPTHPLQHPLLARLGANYAPAPKHHPDICSDWFYLDNVVAPHRILQVLGVDVFTNPFFTPEVIQTIYWRMENNASMSTVNLSPSAPRRENGQLTETSPNYEKDAVHMICLNTNYTFFNHSCEPNLSWHGAVPHPWVGIDWLRGLNGEILRPGCSAVWCVASRDVMAGEELKISYVGNPRGDERGDRESKRDWMKKWFEGGCGCGICASENEERAADGNSEH